MPVADGFEALTAADRPYMRPKTLGKALSIMTSMCDEGHLDPRLPPARRIYDDRALRD
jgi:HD-GYP domain-containing protein (c-di-GMP phosphodiesterase class II)